MQTLLVCDAGVEKSLAKFLGHYRIGATEQSQKSLHPGVVENENSYHLCLRLAGNFRLVTIGYTLVGILGFSLVARVEKSTTMQLLAGKCDRVS